MLIKLTPDQCMKYWDLIKEDTLGALPPTVVITEETLTKMQENLLISKIQFWVVEVDGKILGSITTEIIFDDIVGTKNFLIVALNIYNHVSPSEVSSCLNTLKLYAKGRGCEQVIAYTNQQKIKDIVVKYGGDISYTFLTIPL